MAEFEVSFDTTSYSCDTIVVEAVNAEEASEIAYRKMMWQYDAIEIATVEEI